MFQRSERDLKREKTTINPCFFVLRNRKPIKLNWLELNQVRFNLGLRISSPPPPPKGGLYDFDLPISDNLI